MTEFVTVRYTAGLWTGELMSDIVRLDVGFNHTIRQEFVGISFSLQFFPPSSSWQGIIGMGYSAIEMVNKSVINYLNYLN